MNSSKKRNNSNKTISWTKKLKTIFTNQLVVSSLIISLVLVLLFHLGTIIHLPGVKLSSTDGQDTSSQRSLVDMLNLLSGGGLTKVSIFAVGVSPYITAQIIVQLLSSDLIPPLSKMAKTGERGRKKLEIITRFLTLPFAIAQSYAAIALVLNSNLVSINGVSDIANLNPGTLVGFIFIMTGGTYIAIFIADLITKRGVGNGVTILILSGILSSFIANFQSAYQAIAASIVSGNVIVSQVLSFTLYVLFFILILVAIVFLNGSVRKIPIQQTGQGLTSNIDELAYLPIKVNAAGVIPVIFASSIITIPGTIVQFISDYNPAAQWIKDNFVITQPFGLVCYAVLIFLFTFFYSYIQINPEQLAENFSKSGKFIPGIKNGEDTEKHITKVLTRMNFIGAPYLTLVAILPYIISMTTGIPSGIALGGTGLIIIVTGCMDIWTSINSLVTNTGYNVVSKQIKSRHVEADTVSSKEVTQLW